MKLLSYLILSLFGWKVIGKFPKEITKAVVIAAPHTSNLDFLIGFLAYKVLGIEAKFLVKKEAFFFPAKYVLKAMGAIAIDRSPGNSVVEQVVNEINTSKYFILTIAPEGTRSPVKDWKTGFWRIANQANIPLFLGKIDFQTKTVGLMSEFQISNTMETDLAEIRTRYKKDWAKNKDGYWDESDDK